MKKSLKAKSLCKLDKADIKNHFKELTDITHGSNYLCVKCARSAVDKKWLCKPEKAL